MAIHDLLNPKQYVQKELFFKRISICETCPERLEEGGSVPLKGLSTCPECGCVVKLKAKLKREEWKN